MVFLYIWNVVSSENTTFLQFNLAWLKAHSIHLFLWLSVKKGIVFGISIFQCSQESSLDIVLCETFKPGLDLLSLVASSLLFVEVFTWTMRPSWHRFFGLSTLGLPEWGSGSNLPSFFNWATHLYTVDNGTPFVSERTFGFHNY